jgi:hypothetical protein
MTTATSRHSRLATLAGLSTALIGSSLLPAAARAAGFSGSFDPANWSIVNIGGGVPDQTLTDNGSPPLTNAEYYCVDSSYVACADGIDVANGSVDVVGSSSTYNGGGNPNTVRTTTWTVTNGQQAVVLSFDWSINIANSSTLSFAYLTGSTETPLGSILPNDPVSLSGIALAAGETFGLRVTTSDNIGDYGILSIANFDAVNTITPANVPGPLPMAGGIAAFSWSRRLRSRIRQPNS